MKLKDCDMICVKPFNNLEIHTGGFGKFCCFISENIGSFANDKYFYEIYNSGIAQKIRQSFYDKTYS